MNFKNIPSLDYPFTISQIEKRISDIVANTMPIFSQNDALVFALHSIDLTTLEGNDTQQRVKTLCENARKFKTAAVCVYPVFVSLAKQCLSNSSIRVASVAGAFPAGQSPLPIKLAEVRYAVEQGADEIDMVISRGKFLEGKYEEVFDEIVAVRNECKNITLKVILETGELIEPNLIYKAAMMAMYAGADFIKTSTGKIKINAIPSSFLIMLDAINQYYEDTNRRVGIKPAGGISDVETTLVFLKILLNVLDDNWLYPNRFRIGASRLAEKLFEIV